MDKDCKTIVSFGSENKNAQKETLAESKKGSRKVGTYSMWNITFHTYYCDLIPNYQAGCKWITRLKLFPIENFKPGYLDAACKPNSPKIRNTVKCEDNNSDIWFYGFTTVTPERFDLYLMDARYKDASLIIALELDTALIWIGFDEENPELLAELEEALCLNRPSPRAGLPLNRFGDCKASAIKLSDWSGYSLCDVLNEPLENAFLEWLFDMRAKFGTDIFSIDGYKTYSGGAFDKEDVENYFLFGTDTLWDTPISPSHDMYSITNVHCLGDTEPFFVNDLVYVFVTYKGHHFAIETDIEVIGRIGGEKREIGYGTHIHGDSEEYIREFAMELGLRK